MSGKSDALLLDAGNSYLKWCTLHEGELHDHGSLRYDTDSDDYGIRQAFKLLPDQASQIIVGSVASNAVNAAVSAAADELWDLQVHFLSINPAQGEVQLAYKNLHTFGIDRWLAMLGACKMVDGAKCVADCGTALTLDAISADNVHLGGLIAPGYELMKQALLKETARIDAAGEPIPMSLLADNTADAVNAGCSIMLAAATDRFISETLMPSDVPPLLLVTGGGRERLLKLGKYDAVEVPDLVLRGIATLV